MYPNTNKLTRLKTSDLVSRTYDCCTWLLADCISYLFFFVLCHLYLGVRVGRSTTELRDTSWLSHKMSWLSYQYNPALSKIKTSKLIYTIRRESIRWSRLTTYYFHNLISCRGYYLSLWLLFTPAIARWWPWWLFLPRIGIMGKTLDGWEMRHHIQYKESLGLMGRHGCYLDCTV